MFDKKTPDDDDFYQNILAIDGIDRLLVTPEMISVKHNSTNIETLKMLLMAEIDDYFAEPHLLASPQKMYDDKACAEALADALIRPTLNKDNGGICIHNIKDGIMELSFTGHCAGCPYAQNTLQNVVAKTFIRFLPQIKEIKLREVK